MDPQTRTVLPIPDSNIVLMKASLSWLIVMQYLPYTGLSFSSELEADHFSIAKITHWKSPSPWSPEILQVDWDSLGFQWVIMIKTFMRHKLYQGWFTCCNTWGFVFPVCLLSVGCFFVWLTCETRFRAVLDVGKGSNHFWFQPISKQLMKSKTMYFISG